MTAPRKRRGGLQTALFSAVTVVSLLGLVEIVVRLGGLYDPEYFGGTRLRYQMIFAPLFRPAGDVGYRPRDPRLVDRAFPRGEGERAPTRVFVFGESAVAGLGMSENGSFSRALERRLAARPGLDTSVINCGIVALSSRQVRRVVRDVSDLLRAEGKDRPSRDVFVFHVGNNEFLELHAQRYVDVTGSASLATRLDRVMEGLHLYAWLKQRSTAARHRELTPRSFASQDLRLPETRLVQVVDVGESERQAVIERYLTNMRAMVEAARAIGATPILMTVTTNLEWAGKDDPEGGWLQHAVGGPLPQDAGARRTALEEALERQSRRHAEESRPLERWEALYASATLRRALGDLDGAAAELRRAKDTDPRARRCLSAMNDGVRALARELDVPLVDAEARIGADVEGGIIGFDHLYDYVHFTPLGAERLAELLDEQLTSSGVVPALAGDGGEFARRRLESLATAPHDALDVSEWLGWCTDRAWLSDRDLWKYEATRKRLDERVAAGTASALETVWAANGYAIEVGGEDRARELYARARAADASLAAAIDANIAWLDARAR